MKLRSSLPVLAFLAAAACTDNGNPSDDGDGGGTSGTGTGGSAGAVTGGTGGAATGGSSGTGVTGGTAGTSGTATGGAGGASGGGVTGGAAGSSTGGAAGSPTGGSAGTTAGTGGSAGTAGTGTGGSAGATGGSAGTGGGSGGGSGGLYTCPSGVTGMPLPATPMVTRVAGVPSAFGTNPENSNVEGPVWIGDALYLSHIQENVANPPPSRILKLTGIMPTGTVQEEFLLTAGTNGLAVNAMGSIVGARHSTGDIATLNMTTKAFTPIAGMYMTGRFGSPNDLAIRRDGNIYFSDPNFQAPSSNPQTQTRVYRVNPTGTLSVVDATLQNPNGVTLSLDQNTLYVATGGNTYRYTVMADGSTSTGTMMNGVPGSDGMVVDCAGNLYLTDGNQRRVVVVNSTGGMVGTISMGIANGASPTNVAFGGANHQRLFITTRSGSPGGAGLFYIDLNIPGMPY